MFFEELVRFEHQGCARKASSATAAICDQLLPIDCVTDARPPFVERLTNQFGFVMPTAVRGSEFIVLWLWCSTPEQVLLIRNHLTSFVRDCGFHIGSRAAPNGIPCVNLFGLQCFLIGLPLDILCDECLHCPIRHPTLCNDVMARTICVEALGDQHSHLITRSRAKC